MPEELPRGALELAAVFEGIPRVMFSLKDTRGKYLIVNEAFAERASGRSITQVVGKTASDLFAPELALSYAAQDAQVLSSGHPVRRQLELITRRDGSLGWYITNKSLLHDTEGAPVAIAAVSVDEETPAHRTGMKGLEVALATAHARFQEQITASDLASAAGMSTAMLERRMQRFVGLTPSRLIVRVRVEEAIYRIVRSDRALAEISVECGFTDQAAMSRQVKQFLGVTPRALRNAHKQHPRG
ncbi:MAG: AraC family transcriptional regulator [Acidobacteria bacterium]|nr:AraC family transcriptional regulator [Acidobacteriota bacterium]